MNKLSLVGIVIGAALLTSTITTIPGHHEFRHEPQARAGYQERDQQHVLGTLTGEFCSAIAPRTMTLGNVRELGVRALPGNG